MEQPRKEYTTMRCQQVRGVFQQVRDVLAVVAVAALLFAITTPILPAVLPRVLEWVRR